MQVHSGRSVAKSLHTAMGQAILHVQHLMILTTTWPGQNCNYHPYFAKEETELQKVTWPVSE